jgi:hypothetical protein
MFSFSLFLRRIILHPVNLSMKFFLKSCARKFNAQKRFIEKNYFYYFKDFPPPGIFFRKKNYTAKNTPSEELSGEEYS